MLRFFSGRSSARSNFENGDRLSPKNIAEFSLLMRDRHTRSAARFLGDSLNSPFLFDILIDTAEKIPEEGVAVAFTHKKIYLLLSGHSYAKRNLGMAHRLLVVSTLLKASHEVGARGKILLELGDSSRTGGLCFCSTDNKAFLIPDTDFLSSRGYESFAHEMLSAPSWPQRIDLCFWRGSSTGLVYDDWRNIPRINLCAITGARPDLFDVGLTNIVQLEPKVDIERELISHGYIKPAIAAKHFANYRYTIDIDGNSNAWSSLFTKLLTGSAVLKIASPQGYRQWYYQKLEPMKNFIPIAADLSDLVSKVEWLQKNPSFAEEIGQAGRTLALSLTFDKEFYKAAHLISEVCTN